MSSEQNLPEALTPQGAPPAQEDDYGTGGANAGMGQSKSSRRRRRKRKGKGGDDGGPENGAASPAPSGFVPSLQGQAQPGSFALPGAPAAGGSQGGFSSQAGGQGQDGFRQSTGSFGSAGGQQGGGQQGGGQQGGGQSAYGGSQGNGQQFGNAPAKRWKKKFRDRDRERPRFGENPGNQQSGGSGTSGGGGGGMAAAPSLPRDTNTHQFGNRADGFKRKVGKPQRERGPRSFVGPMDHSYRALNSGYETSPSTIDTFGGTGWSRSYNDAQPIDYSQGRAQPAVEAVATRIYFFIEDLFFLAKINETTRKLGVKVSFVKSDKDSVAEFMALEEEQRPALVVFDLNNANAKPLTLIPKLKAKFKRQTSVIGFLSHLQGDLKAKATEAGCDTVMARSAFSQNLPNLLRRYGLEEETDEGNFNR